MEYSANHDSDEEQEMVASAEWIQNNKKPVRVRLERRNPSRMGLTSPKPTRFLTCYCWKG